MWYNAWSQGTPPPPQSHKQKCGRTIQPSASDGREALKERAVRGLVERQSGGAEEKLEINFKKKEERTEPFPKINLRRNGVSIPPH